MYFNVYSDSGIEIRGYLVPDGFSAEPEILVRVNGEIATQIKCDGYLEGPHKQGLHETGIVGFTLSNANVPGLSMTYDIEISDAGTGFVFYRRIEPGRYIEKRVFRLETHFIPHSDLDRYLAPHFQFHVSAVEQFGSETIRQSLEVLYQPSTYVTGRILIKRFQIYLAQDTVSIIALKDPFTELAARLSVISQLDKKTFGFLTERDRIFFRPAIEHFAGMDLQDAAHIRARVKSAPKDVLILFASPFTHQLTATSPTEIMRRDALSMALNMLSQFTLLHTDGDNQTLVAGVSELLGLPEAPMPVRDPDRSRDALSEVLRSISTLEHVLETDLILHHFMKCAKQRALVAPWGSV